MSSAQMWSKNRNCPLMTKVLWKIAVKASREGAKDRRVLFSMPVRGREEKTFLI